MPLNQPAPNFALLGAFDARQWSGADVIEYDGETITLPTYGLGEGVYEDALFFLHGRGVGSSSISGAIGSLGSALQDASTFGATWTLELTEDDRLKITSDADFVISPIGADPLGLGAQSATFDLGDYIVEGELDWARGVYRGERYLISDGQLTPTTFTWPSTADQPWAAQDVVVAMRERGTVDDADALNPTDCLEAVVRAGASKEVRFVLNDEGHVEVWYLDDASSFTWLSDTFRARLGFSGLEVGEINGDGAVNTVTLTAEHPLPGALFPSRPFQDHHLVVEAVTQSRRLISGAYTSNHVGVYRQSQLSFDLDALLDQRDLYRHFTDRFVPYVPNGERCTFYQAWGDSRRSLTSAEVDENQLAYDLLYTSEDNGDVGRIRATLTSASYDLSFGALKRRVPVSMRLDHL